MRRSETASEKGEARADELFRSRLDSQIDLRHPLAQLAGRMPWAELEDALSATLPPAPVGGGRPALPVRLMAGLLYLSTPTICPMKTCAGAGWRTRTGSSSPARCSSRRGCRAIQVR